jgi:AcrR family transcriptional regulator
MPQQKKEHVRQAILAAARQRFAEQGVAGTPLSVIAAEAGTSIGNLYKYFADKDALFEAAITPTLAQDLRALLREQVEALGTERDATTLPDDHPYRLASARTREFSLRHRFELLFLLRRAEGTAYASFADDLAAELTRLSASYAGRVYPERPLGAANLRALRRIYRAYVGSIADILAEERSAKAIGEATQKLVTYHLAGLRAFFSAVAAHDPEEPA